MSYIKTITENIAGEYVRSASASLTLLRSPAKEKPMTEMINALLGRLLKIVSGNR